MTTNWQDSLKLLQAEPKYIYINDKQRHILRSNNQKHQHTSAGFIASVLILMFGREQTTRVDYQSPLTKLLTFDKFHHIAYNTSRRFTYIKKFKNIGNTMKKLCRQQIIFGLEFTSPTFSHCFLLVVTFVLHSL